MAVLVSDITAEVRDHLTDFPDDTDPRVLNMVNKTHTDVVRACRIYPLDQIDLSLIADQGEYSFNTDAFRVWSAALYQSANDYTRLRETSIDQLDSESPTWRFINSSRPYRYYDLANKIGFYPRPNTTTSGGYPLVRLFVSKRNAFTSVSDALPDLIPTGDAWVYDLCARWAVRQHKEQFPFFAGLAKSAINDLSTFLEGRLVRQKPSARAAYSTPQNL